MQKPRMILLPVLQCRCRPDTEVRLVCSGGKIRKAAIQRPIIKMLVYMAALRAVIRPSTQTMRQQKSRALRLVKPRNAADEITSETTREASMLKERFLAAI